MAKPSLLYACQGCGARYSKWQGRCDACGAWNSIAEEAAARPLKTAGRARSLSLTGLKPDRRALPRLPAGIAEFDQAVGGGLVPGSALLLGGDPGIGKSTLLLQIVAGLAAQGHRCVYISGEEAEAQVQMRAERLDLGHADVALTAAADVHAILATLESTSPPDVVVLDSVQTLTVPTLESAPGTVAQVRASAQALIQFAKSRHCAVILVGHVTKDGQIAGPRVLEHMVDTVLYFEGERGHPFRILRAVKNRFGPTDEIGVFEMTGRGLAEVRNPSDLFLSDRSDRIAGSAVFAGIEGSRPVLVEVQALVAPTPAANPRRTVVGWDAGRLAMVLAVLDARCGLGLAGSDIYLNIAGGLRISEPAADLAVAAALISSLADRPTPPESVFFGELSLSGDVRPVAHTEARLREALKLGFARAYLPARSKLDGQQTALCRMDAVAELVGLLGAEEGVAEWKS